MDLTTFILAKSTLIYQYKTLFILAKHDIFIINQFIDSLN